MINDIITKTCEYLAIPSVVGHESFFMDYLYEDFRSMGLAVFKHDGLLEVHGTEQKSAIVCAHLDRHGLISLGENEYVYAAQYIREIKYSEDNLSSRTQVESIAERFEGEHVYAYHPENGEVMAHGRIKDCQPHMMVNGDALFHVDGMDGLEHNIPLAYSRQASFDDGYLKGQIDNVVSLAVLWALFKSGYQGTALLTCEEEIGKSWLHISDFLENFEIETKNLIIMDTSPYEDQDILDQGPVILRNRDKSEIFNPGLLAQFKARCDDLGLPYQVKDEFLLEQGKDIANLGSTELGRLVDGSKGRWNGATVQVPTMMYHTSNETTTDTAIEHFYKFLCDILIERPL